MLIITSFNEDLFKQYGKRMVNEFSEKSDGTVKLAVMYEGDSIPEINLKNIEFIKLNHTGHHEFICKFGHLQEARGMRISYLPNGQVYLSHNFRFDAVRFSFKIFSLLQALELFNPVNYFAWLDADVRCLKNFSQDELLQFFPQNNQLMSYLGRTKFPLTGAYSECGFLGFNNLHPFINEFLNRVAEIYQNGEVFSYQQWHDCWIWDQTRLSFESRGIEFKNISGDAAKTDHPFINSNLGVFFDHLKGPKRKKVGHSFPEDYTIINKI